MVLCYWQPVAVAPVNILCFLYLSCVYIVLFSVKKRTVYRSMHHANMDTVQLNTFLLIVFTFVLSGLSGHYANGKAGIEFLQDQLIALSKSTLLGVRPQR